MAQINQTITLNPGTPVRLAVTPTVCLSCSIQMKAGGTQLGYVFVNPVNKPPAAANSADLSFELAPASTTAPGGQVVLEGPIDISTVWIDGTHADPVLVSYNTQVGPGT